MIRKEQQPTFDIYVGNLPNHVQEADLKNFFQKYGEIKAVLCRWKNDDIGYAIVKFFFKPDADRVLREVNEVYMKGYHMPVKIARRSDHSNDDQNGAANFKQNVEFKVLPARYNNSFPYLNPNPEYLPFPHVPFPAKEVHKEPLMIEVLCTSVEDAVTFYGCPVFRLDDLRSFSITINGLCPNLPRLTRKPYIKQVYAALYSEDKSWYRCSIQNISSSNSGMCTVCYIDYGNTEEVRYQNMVELPEALQKIPPFCTKCVFCNLECDKSKNSFSKVSYLAHLVNQRMSLCAYFSASSPEYQVYKCSCNGIDVISESVKKGFAKYKGSQRSLTSRSPPVHMNKSLKSKACKSKNSKGSHECASSNASPSSLNSHQTEILKNGEIKNNKDCIPPNINGNGPSVKFDTRSSTNTSKLSPHKNSDFTSDGSNGEMKSKPDIQPKIIIKRGSDLGELSGSAVVKNQSSSEIPKQVEKEREIITIDAVLCNLQLINNIRDLVSTSSNDSIINDAVSLLKSEIEGLLPVQDSAYNVSYGDYFGVLDKIRKCTDKSVLPELKLQRDTCRTRFYSKLKEYVDSFDACLVMRKITIQKTIMDLESKSNAWMNIQLEKNPSSIDEFVVEYGRMKEQRWNLVCNTREKTNEKHKHFLSLFDALRKEFCLNTLDEKTDFSNKLNMSKIGKEMYWSTNFNEALKELGKALEEEIQTFTNKGSSNLSVIQWILKELDELKEKVEAECGIYETRYAMYKALNSLSDVESTLSAVSDVQEKIKCLEAEFIHLKNVKQENEKFKDAKETVLLDQLHSAFSEKDSLMGILVAAAETHFPELVLEHSELELLKYQQSRCLLKYDWKPAYFPVGDPVKRLELSHVTHFLNEPFVIKEYKIGCEEVQKNILQRVTTWNEIKSDYLVEIKGLFLKDASTMCALIHNPWKTLLEGYAPLSPPECEYSCNILRQILMGLRDIHSRKLVHGAVHPLTILIEDSKVLLDFCFDVSILKGHAILKGINFQAPHCEEMCDSDDMYAFGCLVLWMLFPNLLFTTTEENVPNLIAFKSIVENMLSPKDFISLTALLDAKKERRPSSASLVSNGFLTKSKSYYRLKSGNAAKE